MRPGNRDTSAPRREIRRVGSGMTPGVLGGGKHLMRNSDKLAARLSTLKVGSPAYKALLDKEYQASIKRFVRARKNPESAIQFIVGFPRPAHGGFGEGHSRVQSVLFDRHSWSVGSAKLWLSRNGFKYGDLDKTEDKLRFRQEEPGEFVRFRTITAGGSGDMSKSNPKLLSEVDTPAMEKRVLSAAKAILRKRDIRAVFEHGHWWVEHTKSGAQWDAVDAEGPGSVTGFDFEQVTPGEEDNPSHSCRGCGKEIVGSFTSGEYKCSGCGAKVEVR